MKKTMLVLVLTLLALSLYTHADAKSNQIKSGYDMPIKCKQCGEWHLPGVPCPKR